MGLQGCLGILSRCHIYERFIDTLPVCHLDPRLWDQVIAQQERQQ